MDDRATKDTTRAPDAPTPYEAPRVETVLTGDALEREGQYAGGTPE
jgi:hypothetical protein